ncbi:hypothetical protein QBC38DRAFT_479140 [Podospora fimiseda]|uniref:BHLH domain-containing protein n=1 Tax=Podospora fimiseda TaxID=252190 RepID=A0AAN7BP52_9PEZI|nr:hypothetical protein QBC38DRAFT_479140 [Podospora fimiseda]
MSNDPAQNMAEEEERPRLTEQEKKQNHILSEQKRRQAIRDGFDKLTTIVPDLEGQARSEGIVLGRTIDHIREGMKRRQEMIAELEKNGIPVPAELRHSLQSLPEGFLDAEPVSSPGGESSSPASAGKGKAKSGGSGKSGSKSTTSSDGPQQQQ